mmetsp:Transcript_106076/g.188657  ORF Transcript_106076/g.188657 Transcript_106076/m.188657 type:complete len:864 (+) Transcript_106076:49-2640(+)
MAGARVAVTFQVECSCTKPGEEVFVVGGARELGSWRPEKALACRTSAQAFPLWTSEPLRLSASPSKQEFKILVKNRRHGGEARWESGQNRSLHLPKSNGGQVQLTVSCAWGVSEVSVKSKIASTGSLEASQSDSSRSSLPRVDTAAPALVEAVEKAVDEEEEEEESDDEVPELQPATSFKRALSGGSDTGRPANMERRTSRHLCLTQDGQLNPEMSRVPSMMLIDLDELQEESDSRQKEVEALETRARLNTNMRRMASGSLIEQMSEITDYANPSRTFMLQGFNWESWRAGSGDWYGLVGEKADLLADMGFTDVWLPPCSASVAPQGYLPSQLFNLDGSQYGSQAALEALVRKFHSVGLRAVADIVVNHRCGDKQDGQGKWNQFTSGMTSRPSFAGIMDWGGWAITLGDQYSDGSGQHGPGNTDGKFDAAPDIDHRNKKVQESISIWLRWLRLQVGIDGWRFDFVKGYAAEFVGLYCQKSEPAWAVGELWGDMQYDDNGLCHDQNRHRQDLCNWINATGKRSTAFDFTTKGILQEACRHSQYWRLKDRDGKPAGLIGWMPKYAVTFIDNHDTGSTQRHWPFPDDKVLIGYAYILTHPGIPSIFWDHVMDWGEDHRRKIADLMKARRDSEIPVDAKVHIKCADDGLYLAEIGSPPAIRVALGPRGAGEPDMNHWSHGASGNGYRVWVKRSVPPEPVKAPEPAKEAVKAPAPAKVRREVSAPEIARHEAEHTEREIRLQEEVQALRSQAAKLEKEHASEKAELSEQVQRLQQENSALKSQTKQLQKENSSLRSKVTEFQQEATQLQPQQLQPQPPQPRTEVPAATSQLFRTNTAPAPAHKADKPPLLTEQARGARVRWVPRTNSN